MNRPIILLILLLFCLHSKAQKTTKPVINTSAYDTWTQLHGQGISGDGKYIWYSYGPLNDQELLCIRSTGSDWQFQAAKGRNASFTDDSRYCIYLKNDSLYQVDLQSKVNRFLQIADSYKLSPNGKWLLIHPKGNDSTIRLTSLESAEGRTLKAKGYVAFDKEGNSLTYQNEHGLYRAYLNSQKQEPIFQGRNISHITVSGKQTAFVHTSGKQRTIYTSNSGQVAQPLAIHLTKLGFTANATISEQPLKFSSDGKKLFFRVHEPKTEQKQKYTNAPDVWSYHDQWVQPDQEKNNGERDLLAMINLNNKMVLKLEDYETMAWPFGEGINYQIAIKNYNLSESSWNIQQRPSIIIIDLNTGKRDIVIDGTIGKLENFQLSPDERFVIYYNGDKDRYDSYEVSSKRTITNINNGIPDSLFVRNQYTPLLFGTDAWLPNDERLILYDQYDLWLVDPKGEQPPKNITNGFGKKYHITFRLLYDRKTTKTGDQVILIAFNNDTKENGFYQLKIGGTVDPVPRTMGSYYYHMTKMMLGWFASESLKPVKAKYADVYLVGRQTAESSENLYVTKDFKSFRKLTDIHPEKKYNWLTSELHTYREAGGKQLQGVLFKPENFDPHKKYPVIFHYYDEFRSDELHMYKRPALNVGNINIPDYVTSGYLVFLCDLDIQQGNAAESVTRSLDAAADYVKSLPYADSTKFGLQGHSYGGYVTNCMITRSHKFGAACEANGPSDYVSAYNGLFDNSHSGHDTFENGWGGMKATLWENPQVYIKNSPVFFLNKVNTPLLIIHNKEDFRVPFAQGMEMYMGMRRLQKPCWLLQYDREGHTTLGPAADLTIRMRQFFDHYLINKPAPVWMTKGIPANLKGIESGLELDTESDTK